MKLTPYLAMRINLYTHKGIVDYKKVNLIDKIESSIKQKINLSDHFTIQLSVK